MKRFILILCALLMALPMFGCNSVDVVIPQGQIEQTQRSSLVLGIENSQLLVGETGILELTVWCDDSVTDAVTVTDEKETVVAVLENDGTGLLKGTVEILEEAPRFGSMTAVSGEYTSQPVSFRVIPEVTEAQVQALSEVAADLAGAVTEQDFADPNSPEARAFVEEVLTKDNRVSGYTCYDSMILFTTTDGLVGAYSGARREPNTFGFSNPDDVYETHKTGGDVSGQFLFSDMTVSNTKGMMIVPNTDDYVVSGFHGYFEEKVSQIMAAQGGYSENLHDAQAQECLASGGYTDCGFLAINTHGCLLDRSDTSKMLMIELESWEYGEGSLDDMLLVSGTGNCYGSHTEPENNRIVFLVSSEENEDGVEEPTRVSVYATSEFLIDGLGDKTFDNTVIFFIVCYAAQDERLKQACFDHGVSAVVACEQAVDVTIAAYELERFVRVLGTPDEQGNYRGMTQMITGDYSPGAEQDCDEAVENMLRQVLPRYYSGEELEEEINAEYENFCILKATAPLIYYMEGSDKFLIGKETLTGTVSDRDRTPIAGAKVTLLRWLDHTYTVQSERITDDTGIFTAEDIPYGVYVIEAEKDGIRRHLPWIFQPGNQEANTLFFPFTSVTGTVTLKETGAPAMGAEVTVTDGIHTYHTTTGEDGMYLINAVPDGQYTVTAALDELVCDPQSLYAGTGVLGPIRIDIQLKENNARMLLIQYLNEVLIPELGLSGFGEFDIGDAHRYDTFGAFYLEMRGISGAHICDFDGDGAEEMIVAYLRTVSDPDPSNMYPLLGLELRYYDVDGEDQVRALAQQEHLLTNAYDYGTYGVCITQAGGKPYVTVSSYMYDDHSNATATVAVYSMTEDSFKKEEGYLLSSFSSGATLKQFGGDESDVLWKLYNGTVEIGEYTDIVQLRSSINGSLEKYGLTGLFDRLCTGETLIHGDANRLFFSLMEIVANGPTATGYVHRLQMDEYLLDP